MVWHERTRRGVAAQVVGVVLASLLVLSVWSVTVAPIAQARTIDVSQTAQLRLVRKSGSTLYEQGTASGTLPGSVSARFKVTVLKVTGRVTFYPRAGGSITFNVEGFPRSTGVNARFAGTMTISKGTGRYANARGAASFNGIVNRRSWAASVSAVGRMRY
jgi:hypothetical protein